MYIYIYENIYICIYTHIYACIHTAHSCTYTYKGHPRTCIYIAPSSHTHIEYIPRIYMYIILCIHIRIHPTRIYIYTAHPAAACQIAHAEDGGLQHTGWRRLIGSLIFIGHFLQKGPLFSGSLVEKDVQLRGSYESSPPCTASCCTALHRIVAHCNTLQHTATHCNTLQHTQEKEGKEGERHTRECMEETREGERHTRGEVGGWGRDPKKCTGRDWGMGSSTI